MPPPLGRLTYLWSVRDVRRNRRSQVAGFSIVPFAAAARPGRDGVCQLRRKTGKEKNKKAFHSIGFHKALHGEHTEKRVEEW